MKRQLAYSYWQHLEPCSAKMLLTLILTLGEIGVTDNASSISGFNPGTHRGTRISARAGRSGCSSCRLRVTNLYSMSKATHRVCKVGP